MALFGKDKKKLAEEEYKAKKVTMPVIEHLYDEEEYLESAILLKLLLEFYGESKKKNHRNKGREFIYFILSHKHKDLKNVGYSHWVNINKIIQAKKKAVYPYHKQNLRDAIDFFKKEVKSLNNLKTYIVE